MKKVTMMSTIVLGFMSATVGMTSVHGAEVIADGQQRKSTTTTVEIKDDKDTPDPLNPTDPNQKHLTLESVPSEYKFTSKLTHKTYSIEDNAVSGKSIDVFNDRSDRDWSVKASIPTNHLTVGDKQFPVTSFKINDTEIVAQGETGVVSKVGTKDETNTGLIKKAVEKLAISFTDNDLQLKAGDTLSGKIEYKLYNTPDAN